MPERKRSPQVSVMVLPFFTLLHACTHTQLQEAEAGGLSPRPAQAPKQDPTWGDSGGGGGAEAAAAAPQEHKMSQAR